MRSSDLYVVAGGARSGKSKLGERMALEFSPKPIYLASAQAFDDEMSERIRKHQKERCKSFYTIEAPLDILGALESAPKNSALLWDCLTLWLSNCLLAGKEDLDIETDLSRIIDGLLHSYSHVVVVTNEVGLGIVPEHALGRRFRDLAGRCHQRLAESASQVFFCVMGLHLKLKPEQEAF